MGWISGCGKPNTLLCQWIKQWVLKNTKWKLRWNMKSLLIFIGAKLFGSLVRIKDRYMTRQSTFKASATWFHKGRKPFATECTALKNHRTTMPRFRCQAQPTPFHYTTLSQEPGRVMKQSMAASLSFQVWTKLFATWKASMRAWCSQFAW